MLKEDIALVDDYIQQECQSYGVIQAFKRIEVSMGEKITNEEVMDLLGELSVLCTEWEGEPIDVYRKVRKICD